MKTIALAALLLVAQLGVAQGMRSPEERAKQQTERMKTDLNLTTEQATQVHSLNLKYAKKMESIRRNAEDREEMMEMIQKMNGDRSNEMKKILNKEQFIKYEKMQAEQRQQMRGRF